MRVLQGSVRSDSRAHSNLGVCYPGLPSAFHGGPTSPSWRTSEAKEASVLFSPADERLYGYAEATKINCWAAEREKAVVEGEAEPMR